MRVLFRTLLVILIMSGVALDADARVYEVGPDKLYENISEVPLTDLAAGDIVQIHWREQPYKEKFVIAAIGTATKPVRITGVPSSSGQLPVIDGNNAVTPKNLSYWGENRGVIKIGGATKPDIGSPQYIIIENLDITSGRPPFKFTDFKGRTRSYQKFCCALYLETGRNITVRNCIIRDSSNGIVSSHNTYDVVVEGCYILDNGLVGRSNSYLHNTYTESHNVTYQYNRFGPLRDECYGNNLKDRSSGCLVQCNWIEGGTYPMSLVDSDFADIRSEPSYNNTYVYGNVVIDIGLASAMIRYGGDMGDESHYRKGTLFLYNNSFIWPRTVTGGTLARLETDDETADARNNILYHPQPADNRLGFIGSAGTMNIYNNWTSGKWAVSINYDKGTVVDMGGNFYGEDPMFVSVASQDYQLTADSPCIDAGTPARELPEQYLKHQDKEPRAKDSFLDIGAFEYK